MKLCLVLCAAAALADVTPPTISLSFPELADGTQHSDQSHANTPNVTLDAPGTLRNTQSYRSVTCEVGTSAADVAVCPKPTCTAWDHHDESNIACVPTYLLHSAHSSWPFLSRSISAKTDRSADVSRARSTPSAFSPISTFISWTASPLDWMADTKSADRIGAPLRTVAACVAKAKDCVQRR